MILFSFIIPVYNLEKQIEHTIQSILNSANLEIEIIIIDDGSTDGTYAILNQVKKTIGNQNITIISQRNCGVSVARNVGIQYAHGEYIVFCDGDDTVCNNWKTVFTNAKSLTYDMVAWRYYITQNDSMSFSQDIFQSGSYSREEALCHFIMGNDKIRIGSFAIKRQILIEHKIIFTEGCAFAEDIEFIYKCLAVITNIKLVNAPLYIYNKRTNSAIHSFNMKKFQAPLVMERYANFLKQNYADAKLILYVDTTLFILHTMFAFTSNIDVIKTFNQLNEFLKSYYEDYNIVEKKIKEVRKDQSIKPVVFSNRYWKIFCYSRTLYAYLEFVKRKALK